MKPRRLCKIILSLVLAQIFISGCTSTSKLASDSTPSRVIEPPTWTIPPETKEERNKREKLLNFLSQIKGCYWVKEDLNDFLFRKTATFPPKGSEKYPILTSLISAVYESNELFDSMTLRPLNVFYLDLKPGNTSMSTATEMVFDPKWAELQGNEYRSMTSNQVIDRDAVKKAIKKTDGSIVWNEPIEEKFLTQRFVTKGTYKTGLDIFAYEGSRLVYRMKLVPAMREQCVNEDFLEKGLRANDGFEGQ